MNLTVYLFQPKMGYFEKVSHSNYDYQVFPEILNANMSNFKNTLFQENWFFQLIHCSRKIKQENRSHRQTNQAEIFISYALCFSIFTFKLEILKQFKLTSFRSSICFSEKPSMFMHKHEFSLQTGLYYLMCCKVSLYINAINLLKRKIQVTILMSKRSLLSKVILVF